MNPTSISSAAANMSAKPPVVVEFGSDDILQMAADHVRATRDLEGYRLRAMGGRENRGVRVFLIPFDADVSPVYGTDRPALPIEIKEAKR